jgi:hypothetical protein
LRPGSSSTVMIFSPYRRLRRREKGKTRDHHAAKVALCWESSI